MVDASWMARFGPSLVANGYAILPIAPGTKKPGRFIRGKWCDYPGWSRHAARPTTDVEVATWATWPGCGIGIVGGAVAAVDIDIAQDAELALRIEQLARKRLGDTPALRIGRAPKRLLVYRTREPFPGIRRAPLEILCKGQQFVAYAEHPDTGQPYAWPEEGLADLDIDSLPAIDAEMAAAFLDEALALIPAELRRKSLASDRQNGASVSAHAQAGTMPAIRAALAWLPNAELDYDSWVRIGMALKGALGDEGARLFADWSAQAAKNDPATTAKAWESFRPDRIGAGTIYHLAMEKGWRPEPGVLLDGSLPEDATHPAAALLSRLDAQQPAALRDPTPAPPFELTIPKGLVGDLSRYMIDTARRPQPLLAVGASLCAIGALMGRRYRTSSNLRSNLYVVGIADSGSGKNHAREIVNEVFFEAGLAHHLGGNKIASGAGLLTALYRQPAILFQIDEFGMFLSAAADRKRSPRHITEILDNMTELYTAAGGVFLGAEYANRDGSNERRDINQPCLCVYGTTTPLHFWGALQGAHVMDGSLARFLILPSDEDYPDENLDAGIRQPPSGLIAGLKQVAAGGNITGNLAGRMPGPETAVTPMTVPMAAPAAECFRQLSVEITRELRAAAGTPFTAILARIGENARKLALIQAVGRDPVSPEIGLDETEWAIAFVRHFARRTIEAVDRHVADTETEANLKRLREIIRAAGARGITKSEITRASQWLRARDRDEILLTLIESGDVTTGMRGSSTRRAMVYRLARWKGAWRDPSGRKITQKES